MPRKLDLRHRKPNARGAATQSGTGKTRSQDGAAQNAPEHANDGLPLHMIEQNDADSAEEDVEGANDGDNESDAAEDDDAQDGPADTGDAARDSAMQAEEGKLNAKAENLANEADNFDEKLRHDRAIAQREAFLFFLTRGATHSKSASTTNPKTIYFSLMFQLATPFGLLGNMASIISLCDHWRMDKAGKTINDLWWVLLLNSLALACGCIANIILFLHAEKWMRRTWSLIGVCVLYLTATCLYMSLLGSTEVVYFRRHRLSFSRTSGYWHAVCGSVLYFFSAFSIASNLLYFRGKKWNATMSRRQRRIMTLCSLYIAWIAIGGATFQPRSMIDIAYADSAYYCVVSCLTLGYGDITPSKTLPRALVIPYIYVGLILGGFATLSIFQASLSSARNESITVHVEQRRHAALEKPLKSEQQSFDTMRHILRTSRDHAVLLRAVLTVSWLVVFWLIGALILKYTEGWTYFEAFYYVAVSLATVGYGDFTPKSAGGRSFFLYWALLAVPTMTTAVSDMSAVGVQWVQALRELAQKWRLFGLVRALRWYRDQHNLSASSDPNEETMSTMNQHLKSFVSEVLPNRKRWHDITRLAALPPNATFPLDTWHAVVCEILGVRDLPIDFWLSDMSPIRFTGFNEREFIVLATLNMLRLSMPDTEHELTLKNAPAPNSLDATSTVTTSDLSETKQPV